MKGKYKINYIGLRNTWRNPTISIGAKVILQDLLLYAGQDGSSFPSQNTLAQNHNLSSRHVRNLINELQNNNLLSKTKRGFPASNIYTFSEEIYCLSSILERKLNSSELRKDHPLQERNAVPTKVVNESNQLSSSEIQQLFEKTSNKKCHSNDVAQLDQLCQTYTPEWVHAAIKEASTRKISYLTVKYVRLILQDWKDDGKPQPKPIFKPCVKCEGGYFISDNICTPCDCIIQYEQNLESWERSRR